MISAIIPMRNAAGTVHETVSSLLASPAVVEIIVVDDGSTDASRAVVESIGDPRVQVIDGPTEGIAAAVNAGFGETTAPFIARCDADDIRSASMLQRQLEWLSENPAFGAICGGFATFSRRSGPRVVVTPEVEPLDITRDLLRGRTWTHLNTFLVRRETWDRAGPFRSWFESAEDIDFQLRLAEAGRVWFDSRVAYEYRLADRSITHRQSTTRRVFFENAARHFALQRRERGADDLALGRPPMAPPETGRPLPAAKQFSRHLLGAAARSWRAGDRSAAVRAAAGACRRTPLNMTAWRTLVSVGVRPIPAPTPGPQPSPTLLRPRRSPPGTGLRSTDRSATPKP